MEMNLDDIWIPDEWKGKIVVEDDFLPITHFEKIQEYVNHISFPWCFEKNLTTKKSKTEDSIENFNHGFGTSVLNNVIPDETGNKQILKPDGANSIQFTPLNKNFISFITPFLWNIQDYIGVNFILNSRFDMTLRTPYEEYIHPPHIDFPNKFPHISTVIYMNDTDGDTIFFNETSAGMSEKESNKIQINDLTIRKRVKPKKGRMIIFDGSFFHTGCSPYKFKNRIILNTIFTNMPNGN